MKILGIHHIGLKVVSIGLAMLLWLVVTGNPAPRMVPVVPLIEGEPAEGFRLGEVSTDPVTVEVVGPADDLALVTAVVTEVLSVEGATGPFNGLVDVDTENPAVRLSVPVRVRVIVDVVPVE
jgi:YbbR domain-containing protein